MSAQSIHREREKTSYYTICFHIGGRLCVVVGGGQVALRKVQTLLQAGALVRVVSPQMCAPLQKMARARIISALVKEYEPADLKGSRLVIAATGNPVLNSAIARDARRRHTIVNVVDSAAQSDFIVPSCLTRGDLTIAVSTAGRSPALARRIRIMLEGIIGDEYAALLDLVAEVRKHLKRQGIKVSRRQWQEALDIDALTGLLRQGERRQARSLLLARLGVNDTEQ